MVHRAGWFGEAWRVLLYALLLALGFVLLGRLQLAAFTAPATQRVLQHFGLLDGNTDTELAAQAQAVAAASREAMQHAPTGHRLDTLRLGYQLGYVSERIGLLALATPQARERARELLAPQQADADVLAQKLGVAPAAALPSVSLREFNDLTARYEADGNGIAARLQQRWSPWHRHAYLLGVHLGIESARIDASGGEHSMPPATLIRRHATLAGIAPALWLPLAEQPGARDAAKWRQHYRAAVQALAASLAQQDVLPQHEPRPDAAPR